MELAGFEPATFSLRKMSKPCHQGKRHRLAVLWRGCGTSVVRRSETRRSVQPKSAYVPVGLASRDFRPVHSLGCVFRHTSIFRPCTQLGARRFLVAMIRYMVEPTL